ncbi:MAG: alpha-galactosidase, partial [Clostridia bacterium]
MFEKFNFKIYYNVDGIGKMAEGNNEHFSLKIDSDKGSFSMTILPKIKMDLVHVEISSAYSFNATTCVLPNGYQSWTMTKEFNKNEKQIGLRWPCRLVSKAKEIASVFGDYSWKHYPKTKGFFHGYTYGYVRNGNEYELIGSLSERQGYTIINFDMKQNLITIEKEVEGKSIESEYKLFDLVFIKGSYNIVFDKYFKAMNISAPRVSHTTGYTSWYNYFTKIDENVILRDLNGLDRVKDKINIFQIDDGYQSAIGDWTVDTAKFPKGMKFIADSIHEKGYKAGLWLAPFYCQKDSKIAIEHPEWLVKYPNGKSPYGFVGNRTCFTFDFYNEDCAKYLKGIFSTVLNDWGFDLVKLDFLCTECLVPRRNKTRGEIMCDAMDFLRECVGEKLILGCGVPLGP